MLSRKIINLNYMGSNCSNKAHSTKYEVVLSQNGRNKQEKSKQNLKGSQNCTNAASLDKMLTESKVLATSNLNENINIANKESKMSIREIESNDDKSSKEATYLDYNQAKCQTENNPRKNFKGQYENIQRRNNLKERLRHKRIQDKEKRIH